MTSYALRAASPAKTRADAVIVGVLSASDGQRPGKAPAKGAKASSVRLAPGGEDVAEAYGRKLAPLLAALGVTGKAGEVTKVPTGGAISSPLLVLVGLGPDGDPRAVRRAAGSAARAVTNAASVAVALPADTPELVAAATEGWLLGGYTFTTYKSARPGAPGAPGAGTVTPGSSAKTAKAGKAARKDKVRARVDAETDVAEVVLLTAGARRKEVVAAFADARVVAESVAVVRDWVNTPPGDLTPPAFADAVVGAVEDYAAQRDRGATKVAVRVVEEDELATLGCGGLLGVGAGSAAPPRLVELTYAPKGATTHLALVGKGITFDSGGLTIKPGASMKEMKSDMAGAATVVQATLAIARLGVPVRVTAYAAMAENMVGGAAMRPGDVLTMYGGTTVEVTNTDAEGRLVLADALVMATEQAPDLVVDVATLTGAMVVALGDKITGVMGDDAVVAQVLAAAATAGEDFWAMPIPDAMVERIHSSPVADLTQSDWVRWGGGLFAAAFLREFTGGLPWAHLDIAGPSYVSGSATGHLTGGGTGVAVATLVQLARDLAGPTG